MVGYIGEIWKLKKGGTNLSIQFAQKVVMEYFKTNQSVCESFFLQQERMFSQIGNGLPLDSRRHLLDKIIELNKSIVTDMLFSQEIGLRQFIGIVNPDAVDRVEEQVPKPIVSETQKNVYFPQPQQKKQLHSQGIEKWLRAEISRVTGFDEEVIINESCFEEDFGLSSIDIIEILAHLIQAFPEFEDCLEKIGRVRTIADLLNIVNNHTLLRETSQVTDNILCSEMTQEYPAPLERFIMHIKQEFAKRLDKNESQLEEEADFEENFNINIFEFEEILTGALDEYPQFKLAGRELFNMRNFKRIRELLKNFGQDIQSTQSKVVNLKEFHKLLDRNLIAASISSGTPTQPTVWNNNKGDEQVRRFVLEDSAVSKDFDNVELPQSVLLIGEPGNLFEYCLQGLIDNGVLVRTLFLTGTGWVIDATKQEIMLEDIQGLKKTLDEFRNKQLELPPIIFLASGEGDPMEKENLHRWMEQLDQAATGLFALAKASCYEKEASGDFIGVIGLLHQSPAWSAARGVLRTLRHDCPRAIIQSVWLTGNYEETSASYILKAVLNKTNGQELIIEQECIKKKQIKDYPVNSFNSSGIHIDKDSLLLLIGGGDGITAEVGCMLARQYKCRIVVIGRTPLTEKMPYSDIKDEDHLKRQIFADLAQELNGTEQVSKEVLAKRRKLIMRQRAIWNTCKRVESEGGIFRYYSADATQREALVQVIDTIHKDLGPIHGVIHGAGIIEPIRDKTMESFRRVVNTKAYSIYHLYHLLKNDPLKFVTLFSSITAYTGYPNLGDYSAANEVLNQVGEYWNVRVSYPVRSILWTLWTETGLMKNAKSGLAHFDIQGISNELGVKLFLEELLYGEKSKDWVLYTNKSMLEFLSNPDSGAIGTD